MFDRLMFMIGYVPAKKLDDEREKNRRLLKELKRVKTKFLNVRNRLPGHERWKAEHQL